MSPFTPPQASFPQIAQIALWVSLVSWVTFAAPGCDTSPTPHPGSPDTADTSDLGKNDTVTPPLDTGPPDETSAADSATPPDTDLTDDSDLIDVSDTDTADTTDTDTDTTDTGPELPTEPATLTPLADGSWHWVLVVGPQTLVVSDGTTIYWTVGDVLTPIPGLASMVDPMTAPPAAARSGNEVMLGGDGGLLRLVDGIVAPSPLSERFTLEPISSLSGNNPLWISTHAGLYRWQADTLVPIQATGVALADNLVAATAGGAWLSGPHGTSLVTVTPPTLTFERPSLTPPSVTAIGLDDRYLYVLAANDTTPATPPTTLHVRLPDRWDEAELDSPAMLSTHPSASAVWVVLKDNTLTRGSGTSFARVGPLPGGQIQHLAAHADGRVVLATDHGLYEASSRRTVSIAPLPSPLPGSLTVTVRASDAALLASATASVSTPAGPIVATSTLSGQGADRRLTVMLDPLTLPNGAFELTVSVTWSDGETASTSATFSVDEPTWEQDIGPLFDRQCKSCHAADNGGNFASLHTPDRWSSRMDEILCRVDQHDPSGQAPECSTLGFEVASMPPGRTVAPPQVELLRKWRAAGYRP